MASQVLVAESLWARLRGMLARPAPGPGEGMLLAPCRAVHMFGMRYPLDIAFLRRDGEVVAIYEALAPGARTGLHRDAWAALELPAGTLSGSGVRVGDRLTWEDQP